MNRSAGILVALALAGCRGGFVRHSDAPSASAVTEVGTEVGVKPTKPPGAKAAVDESAAAVAGADTGVLDVVLKDQHDRSPEGIRMDVAGPVTVSVTSDPHGHARFEGPAGTYRFSVPVGCSGAVHVTYGEGGRAGIVAGRTVQGELLVRWRARYAPDWPVHTSFVPDFPLGQAFDVRFDVHDRCSLDRASDAMYASFAFEPSANLRVVDAPRLRADRNGYGYLRLQCTAEGPVRLYSFDRRNADDRLELLANASGRTPVCKRL